MRVDEEVQLSLARACVAAGEEQVLKVRAPRLTVAIFETTYADGKGGASPPYGAGYGGNGSEIVPESGVAEMRWRVSPDAPSGEVRVGVGILREGQQEEELTFTVVGEGGRCG